MNTRKLGRLLVIFLLLFAIPMFFTACAGKKKGGGGGGGPKGDGDGAGAGGPKGKKRKGPKNPNGQNPPVNPNGNQPPAKNPQSNYQCRPGQVPAPRPRTPGPLPPVPPSDDPGSPTPNDPTNPPGAPTTPAAPPSGMNDTGEAEYVYARYDGAVRWYRPRLIDGRLIDGTSPRFAFAYAIYSPGDRAAYVTVDLPAAPPSGGPHDPTDPAHPPGREEGHTLESRLQAVERFSYHGDASDSGVRNDVVRDLWTHRDPQNPKQDFYDPKTRRRYRLSQLKVGDAARALTESNGEYLECARPGQGRAIFFEQGDSTFLPDARIARSAIRGVPAELLRSEEERKMLGGEFAGQSSISHLFREWVAATNGLRAELREGRQNVSEFKDYLERSMKYTMYALASLHSIPAAEKKKYQDVWVYNTARVMQTVREAKARRPVPYDTKPADDMITSFFDDTKRDWAMLRGQALHVVNRRSLQRLFNARPGATPTNPNPAPPGALAAAPPSVEL